MNRPVWAIVIGVMVVLILVAMCAFIILPTMGAMGSYGFGMMRPGMMGGIGFTPLRGIAMLLFGAFILAGIVLLVVWLARGAGQSSASTPGPRGESALEILKVRYAKGEITREQYEAMRHDLE